MGRGREMVYEGGLMDAIKYGMRDGVLGKDSMGQRMGGGVGGGDGGWSMVRGLG